MSKVAKAVLIEIGMLIGCFVAAFTVPRSTPIRTFVIICVSALVVGNAMLLSAFRKHAGPARKANYTRLYFGVGLCFLYWILSFVWK
jgi:hypothetical protein